jgi:hypothetical protein
VRQEGLGPSPLLAVRSEVIPRVRHGLEELALSYQLDVTLR